MSDREIDTNVASFLMKKAPLGRRYRRHLLGHSIMLSFMSAAEMLEGAERAAWGEQKRRDLEKLLARFVVVHSTIEICEFWARVRTERRSQPIAVDDAWIAATALAYNCPLVTHNPKDFQGISDLTVITEAQRE